MPDEQLSGDATGCLRWDSDDELLAIQESFEQGEFEMKKDVVNALIRAVLAAIVCAYVFIGIAPIVLATYAHNWIWAVVAVAVYIVNLFMLRWIRKEGL